MGLIKTDRRYLTGEELKRVVAYVRMTRPLQDRVMCSLLLLGLRIGEVRRTKRSQLDIEGWVLTYTPEKQKDPKVHRVPIPSVLRTDFLLGARQKAFPPDWPLVGLNRTNCSKHIKQWGRACGVPWLFAHAFRHTFAVTWIDSGGNLTELQSWLGHSDPKTTTQYLRWSTKHLEGSFDRLGLAALLAPPAAPVNAGTGGSSSPPMLSPVPEPVPTGSESEKGVSNV